MNILTLVLFLIPTPLQEAREWEMQNLLNEIGPRIDRTFIYNSDLIPTMKKKPIQLPPLSRERSVTELTRILELALQNADLMMIPPDKKGEPWGITYESRAPKKSLPYLFAPNPIPEGHAYYCWVYFPKHFSARNLYPALINRVSYPQGILAIGPMLLLTGRASKLRNMEKILAHVDRPKVTRVNLGKIQLPELASEPIDERLEKIALIKEKKEPREDADNPRQQDDDRPESKTRRIHSSASREVWLFNREEFRSSKENLAKEFSQYLTVAPHRIGLRVTQMESNKIGFARGLMEEDIIRSVNGKATKVIADIDSIQNHPRTQSRKSLTFVIQRKGRNMVLEYRAAP
ncbi:MAG: hypothetical protein QF645_06415 [Planctomycetota bacterium]|nr:hypothetical protein [Planctomycetota bacterium]